MYAAALLSLFIAWRLLLQLQTDSCVDKVTTLEHKTIQIGLL